MIVNPAETLSNILKTKVILEKASSEPIKLGSANNLHQHHLISNAEDKFLVSYGPGVEQFVFGLSQDEAFAALAERIIELKKVKFHLLWLPTSGVVHCSVYIRQSVIIRTIEFYRIESDELLTRYDVLVQAID